MNESEPPDEVSIKRIHCRKFAFSETKNNHSGHLPSNRHKGGMSLIQAFIQNTGGLGPGAKRKDTSRKCLQGRNSEVSPLISSNFNIGACRVSKIRIE